MAHLDSFPRLLDHARRHPPRLALILGSGLGELARRVECLARVSFRDVPGLELPSVPGHQGTLTLGIWADQTVLVFSGRIHFYEGYTWQQVVRPAHIAHELGARFFILTNAAGGIRDDLIPGSLLALSSHLDWTGEDKKTRRQGEGETRRLSPCLPLSLSPCLPHDAGLVSQLQAAAHELGITLPTGRYAQVTGPSYETPAEIRALRSLGVDAVGMSTAREAQAGFELGLTCAAVSCITNRAAGLGPGRIDHDEVLACTSQSSRRLADLLERFLERLTAG